jgi:hypothetical protein
MRVQALISIGLSALFLHSPVSGQEGTHVELLAQAERTYPDSKAPKPFSTGSVSSPYAGEPEDRIWSAEMEARILAEIEIERDQGLIIRRAEVECRSTTCGVLLVHAVNAEEGSIGDLLKAFRDSLGFVGVSKSETEIPLQQTTSKGAVRTRFISGYVDVLLTLGG